MFCALNIRPFVAGIYFSSDVPAKTWELFLPETQKRFLPIRKMRLSHACADWAGICESVTWTSENPRQKSSLPKGLLSHHFSDNKPTNSGSDGILWWPSAFKKRIAGLNVAIWNGKNVFVFYQSIGGPLRLKSVLCVELWARAPRSLTDQRNSSQMYHRQMFGIFGLVHFALKRINFPGALTAAKLGLESPLPGLRLVPWLSVNWAQRGLGQWHNAGVCDASAS